MVVHLIVEDNLEKIATWSQYHHAFGTQKDFNDAIMHDWKMTSRRTMSINAFIDKYREIAANKMVISIDDSAEGKKFAETVYKFDSLIIDNAKMQEQYDALRKKYKISQFKINSLQYHVDIALRRAAIFDYFKTQISPKISDDVAQLSSSRDGFNLKATGWGYIAAYKHEVVIEFADRNCHWIKMLYSKEALELVNQNFTKNNDNRIFYGKADEKLRYIDIFTCDTESANLFHLITEDKIKVLNVNLTPMIASLKEQDLFYAIPAKKHWNSIPEQSGYNQVQVDIQ